MEFDLPAGTTISSLWNGEHTVSGSHVTVKPTDGRDSSGRTAAALAPGCRGAGRR
ncbi:hypothetical protein [Streptomyces zaomyceticus]|uniref:hypothetical protein n=1 Tax=Streptomyces zaomyceticus TaxID=68286 RepID=UPI003F4CFCE5